MKQFFYRTVTFLANRTFVKNVSQLVKTLLYYTIKFDLLLIYSLSNTILFFVWLVMIILGFFVGKDSNVANLYCLLGVTYVLGTSLLICLVCSTKKSSKLIEFVVGVPFLDKYAFKKGRYNLYILFLPFIIFLFIDVLSIEYLVSLKREQYQMQSLLAQEYFNQGNLDMASQTKDSSLQILEKVPNTKGFMGQIAISPFFTIIQNYISKLLG